MSLPVVKIKNINSSHKIKKFIVKGRIKPLPSIQNNSNRNGKHLAAILYDKTSSIHLVAFDDDCDKIFPQLEAFRLISLENVEVKEVKKMFMITNHKYNLILKSSTTIIKNINNFGHCFKDYPKYPIFSNNLTTLRSETIVDVIGEFTEMGNIDETRSFRPGKIKIGSSEIRVKFFGEKADIVYDVGRTVIIYSAKLKFYQGNNYLNILSFSYVECSPNLFALNFQSQSSHVTRGQQTVTENLIQPVVISNAENIIKDTVTDTACELSDQNMPSTLNPKPKTSICKNNENKVVVEASETTTTPQRTDDEMFIYELLYHLNKLPEASKIKIRKECIDLAKKEK